MTPEFELKDGVLTIYREMDFDYDVGFDRACNELVNSSQDTLVIDLSRIRRITSTCVGMMAAAFFQARSRGKTIGIIAQGNVLQILQLAGFDTFIRLTDSGRFTYVAPKEENATP